MQQVMAGRWRAKGWAVPISLLLHFAVVAAFLFELPERIAAPPEPDSISVDLVPPPEEKKEEEGKPPAAKQAEQEKPPPSPPSPAPAPAPPVEEAKVSPPMPSTLPAIAMRPQEAQADREDKPGKVPEGEETPVTEEAAEPEPQKTIEEKPAPAASSDLKASAEQGEIAVSPVVDDSKPEQAPVPQPKPAEERPQEQDEKKAKLPKAKSLLSSSMLSAAQRRQMFGDLPPRRRIVQLCSTEALAQIQGAGFAARGMIPYSDTGGRISGNAIDASGGAFNTGDTWHDVSFQCEVDLENYAVTEFRFKIGNALRPEEAKRRGFTQFQ